MNNRLKIKREIAVEWRKHGAVWYYLFLLLSGGHAAGLIWLVAWECFGAMNHAATTNQLNRQLQPKNARINYFLLKLACFFSLKLGGKWNDTEFHFFTSQHLNSLFSSSVYFWSFLFLPPEWMLLRWKLGIVSNSFCQYSNLAQFKSGWEKVAAIIQINSNRFKLIFIHQNINCLAIFRLPCGFIHSFIR